MARAGGAVTVAIPVLDGGAALAGVLDALGRQTVEHELLICDSGSSDGSAELARSHGARLLEIDRVAFGHGRTRNLLMREAGGDHVALLTQDAEPADERWLERLLEGFSLADDVGLVYGPYVPRPDAPVAVAVELRAWFQVLSADGRSRLDRLTADERRQLADGVLPRTALIGARGFFTDVNACIAKTVWERVPFRDVVYAEDRALALDMMQAGYAKAYVPEAGVWHSHSYTASQELRRAFDEWRALQEIYGWREPLSPRHLLSRVRGDLGTARRDPAVAALGATRRAATLAAVARKELARLAGAVLGSRADALPDRLARVLSLESRGRSAAGKRRTSQLRKGRFDPRE